MCAGRRFARVEEEPSRDALRGILRGDAKRALDCAFRPRLMTIIHVSNRVSNQDHINLHELTQIKAGAWHAPDAIFNEGGAMAAQDEEVQESQIIRMKPSQMT